MRRAVRPAFTLVETALSTIIVSVLLVAAVGTVSAARLAEGKTTEKNVALALAQSLLGEILQQAYTDPTGGLGSFGVGSDENTGNRSLFEDVDDYTGWTASPPQNKDGSTISWASDYQQVVEVAWVNAGDLISVSGSETGVKRIRVTIRRQTRDLVTLTAYRTMVWSDPAQAKGGSR
jgi:type II secretory pathway pseudopilin PulG